MSNGIENVVRACAKEQRTVYRLGGGAMVASGLALALLSLFVEGKPGEEAIRVGAGVLGVVLVGAGVAYLKVMTARVATLIDLLLLRRSELREPGIIAMRRAGVVIAHVITVRDARGTKYRMRVPSEADARAMLANIPSQA